MAAWEWAAAQGHADLLERMRPGLLLFHQLSAPAASGVPRPPPSPPPSPSPAPAPPAPGSPVPGVEPARLTPWAPPPGGAGVARDARSAGRCRALSRAAPAGRRAGGPPARCLWRWWTTTPRCAGRWGGSCGRRVRGADVRLGGGVPPAPGPGSGAGSGPPRLPGAGRAAAGAERAGPPEVAGDRRRAPCPSSSSPAPATRPLVSRRWPTGRRGSCSSRSTAWRSWTPSPGPPLRAGLPTGGRGLKPAGRAPRRSRRPGRRSGWPRPRTPRRACPAPAPGAP